MPDSPVILITGASSGIGAAVARRFTPAGYRLVLAARRLDRLQALVHEIGGRGGQALPLAADLSRLEDIRRLAQAVLRWVVALNGLFPGLVDWAVRKRFVERERDL